MCPFMNRMQRLGWPAWRAESSGRSLPMTLPRTVADVLSDHVVFEIESIDRLYLNVYQPRLQYGGGCRDSSSATAATSTLPRSSCGR